MSFHFPSARCFPYLSLLLAVVAHADAIDVNGSLTLPSGAKAATQPEAEPGAYFGEQPNGFVETRDLGPDWSRELAVVLTAPGSGAAQGPTRCTYGTRGGDLAPSTLVVRAGSAVDLKNHDGVAHEFYAEGLNTFEPFQVAPGGTRTVKVPQTGRWTVRDRLYPHVSGYLHAISDLVTCARVEPDGRFTFTGVTPGFYTLKVFSRDRELLSQRVQAMDPRGVSLDPIAVPAVR